jgi:hypothetical protein
LPSARRMMTTASELRSRIRVVKCSILPSLDTLRGP